MNDDSDPRQFVTTHWSVVLRAGGCDSTRAQAALSELCHTYWYPLYAFVRRQGHNAHDAEDLTQGFFAKLLEKNYLASVQEKGGRFRSFLLTALKGFLANEWDRARTVKRGGRESIVSIDAAAAESRYRLEPTHEVTPERIFERRWAQTLLDQVLNRLRDEYAASGRAELFSQLQGSLSRQRDTLLYSELGRRLTMTEAAVKMAVKRMRLRYRGLLREEIGKTVGSPDEIEEELRYLFATFG